jgi:hypothetical protein
VRRAREKGETGYSHGGWTVPPTFVPADADVPIIRPPIVNPLFRPAFAPIFNPFIDADDLVGAGVGVIPVAPITAAPLD